MAGLFGGSAGFGAPQGMFSPDLGILGAALKDAAASFSGQGDSNSLQQFSGLLAQNQARQQLMAGLSSADPAVRQKAYMQASMLGVDPKPFQDAQTAQATPDLLAAMRPSTQELTVPAAQANLGSVNGVPNNLNLPASPTGNIADVPGQTLPDAVAGLAIKYPELAQKFAPDIIKQSIENQNKAVTTLTPQEAVAAGFRPNAVVQRDAFGNLKVAQASDVKSQEAANQQIELENRNPNLAIARANLGLSQQRLALEKEKGSVDPKAVDLGVQYFLQYGKLPPTARNPAMQGAIMSAASDRLSAQGKTMEDVVKTAQTNHAANKSVAAFDTGKQGDTTRSLNVSVAHLNTLKDLGAALQNGDVTLINTAKQKFAEAFGVPAPTNFDAARAIVADEVAKGVIGGQTAQSDREALAASLQRNRSPQAINGAIGTFQNLLAGQLHGLRQQYKSSTGRDDFNDKLFPETVQVLEGAHGMKSAAPINAASLPRIPVQHPADVQSLLKKYGQ